MLTEFKYDKKLKTFVIDDETAYFHLRPSADYSIQSFRKAYKGVLHHHQHDENFLSIQAVRALCILFSNDALGDTLPTLSQQAQNLLPDQTLELTGRASTKFEKTLRAHCLHKNKTVSILRNNDTKTTTVTIGVHS